jgi:hypothetical protein
MLHLNHNNELNALSLCRLPRETGKPSLLYIITPLIQGNNYFPLIKAKFWIERGDKLKVNVF